MNWESAETAPIGVPVLGYFPDAIDPIMKVHLLEFDGDPDGPQWWLCDHEDCGAQAIDIRCTHWSPLPEPPAKARGDQQ